MLSIHELLEDAKYKKFFLTRPPLPKVTRLSPPWRLYGQLEPHGVWRKKDYWDYADAVKAFARLRKAGLHDASITCRPIAWEPPTRLVRVRGKFHTGSDGVQRPVTKQVYWRPSVPADEEPHIWCPYCRRPTVFRAFANHHAFTGDYKKMMDPGAQRCIICGIRLEGLKEWARRLGL
jgi:hypothetical protein